MDQVQIQNQVKLTHLKDLVVIRVATNMNPNDPSLQDDSFNPERLETFKVFRTVFQTQCATVLPSVNTFTRLTEILESFNRTKDVFIWCTSRAQHLVLLHHKDLVFDNQQLLLATMSYPVKIFENVEIFSRETNSGKLGWFVANMDLSDD